MANQPNTKKTKTPVSLSQTLRTIPATAGIDQLRRLHEAYDIIPATAAATIEPRLEALEVVLRRNNTSVLDLASNQAATLSVLTGIPQGNLTQYHATQSANEVHSYRNVALAVAALAASTVGVPSAATHPQTVYAHSIKLARRSPLMRRPFEDDEVVLCRVAAHLAARENPRDHAATIYTLTDAGLVPGETTHVTIEDVDDPEMPQVLLAAGNAQIAARFIELDRFTTHTLGRHIEQALRAGHAPKAPLTYAPRARKNGEKHQSGSVSATASAQRIIDRFLEQLRLPTGDITATSITQWRVATTLKSQGVQAAWAASGRTNVDAMWRALGMAPTESKQRPADDTSFAAAA